MPKKTFIGDLFLNDDYADRRSELNHIRSGIHDKLISLGVQFTENLDEADFVIIFVTRCFLPRSSNLLSRIHDVEGIQHVSIICDKSHLSAANNELDINRLLYAAMSGDEEKGYELVKDCDPKLKDQIRYYLSTLLCSAADNFQFPDDDGESMTDSDSLVDSVVSCILKCVNRLNIDLVKAIGMEPDIFKITDLISKNAGRKTTRFVVISGCRQSHDISTVTKYLAMEQMPGCDLLFYHDCTDIHEEFLSFAEQWKRPLKFLLVLDGVSSIKQLKEIRKLDAVLIDQFPGSIVMLSTDVDIFRPRKSHFKSRDLAFLGYVDGASISGQPAKGDYVANGWGPFCFELDALQLEDYIANAERKAAGHFV